jgi:hypothetical protein
VSDFVVSGSPRSVSERIEECARASGNVTALVVPWESSGETLSMAVTLVKSDGWAIEHTNLGTITLTPDGDATRVAAIAHPAGGGDTAKLATLFERFASDLARRLPRAGSGK